jgi:uncharacterized membrane protein YeaQ/YmgE (transglycosylase-associated protein family)
MAQALLPKGKPQGLYGVLVIGVCGSCAGVFLVDLAAKSANVEEFTGMNPIGPVGLFASVVVSFVIILFYRFALLIASYCKKKPAGKTTQTETAKI